MSSNLHQHSAGVSQSQVESAPDKMLAEAIESYSMGMRGRVKKRRVKTDLQFSFKRESKQRELSKEREKEVN